MSDFDKQDQVKEKIKTAAKDIGSNKQALVAIKNDDEKKSAIYLVKGGSDTTNGNDITLDLLGIVGHKIDTNDKLGNAGVIEFYA